jgi:primosomal protein N' (replication factor Y)
MQSHAPSAIAPAALVVAQVALEQPLSTPLDYLVPESLSAACQLGQRVLVPLGPRHVQGYVVGLTPRSDLGVGALKPIVDVLDEVPLLTSALLTLTHWVADYYMCPWGLVLKAAVPQGFRVRSEAVYSLTPRAQADPSAWPGGRSASALQSLAEHGPQRRDELARTLEVDAKGLGPLLRRLQTAGWVAGEQQRQTPKVRQRMVAVVRLTLSPEAAEALRQEVASRAPKQADVLAQLIRQPLWELADLQARVPGARAAVQRLVQRGAVAMEQVEKRRSVIPKDVSGRDTLPRLSPAQQHAFQQIEVKLAAPDGVPVLLLGVTGSGKTEVYMRAIDTVLKQDKTALVLVPEISLTAQATERFTLRFGDRIAVLHSGLSAGERFDEWRRLARGEARIAIGARSAVFAPLPNLGLIIVDEEHDTSYKQEEAPRYHARDVAIVRAQQERAVVVLGSATPALETFHHARRGKYLHLALPERVGEQPLPKIMIVDQRAHATPPAQAMSHERVISTPLHHAIADRLERGEQCLILINRRGYSAYLQCRECGDVPHCAHCSVSLTYHARGRTLKCHYCDYSQPAPTTCLVCHGPVLHHYGVGTQQVEDVLRTLFPQARLGRMDRDTTRGKAAHERILRSFGAHEVDILIGTQMIAKGHDFPNITLVGVVSADGALSIPDFRAPERLFQLLTQVAGRAGRGERPGEVLIQTFRPDYESMTFAREHDFLGFFQHEIQNRQLLLYPPYTRLAKVLLDSPNPERVQTASEWLAAQFAQHSAAPHRLEVLGPAEAPLAKLQNRYRWHIMLKAATSRELHQWLQQTLESTQQDRQHLYNVRMSIDIDPLLFL